MTAPKKINKPAQAQPKTPPAMPATVDAYIAGFSGEVAARLDKVCAAIARAVPGAEQGIAYRIAAFKLDGKPLLYFAGFKGHIGLYPMTAGVKAAFAAEMAAFPQAKGTLRFPHDGTLPVRLIAKIARLRAGEVRAAGVKAGGKTKTKGTGKPKGKSK